MITRCIFLLAFVFTITANAQNYFINEDFSNGINSSWTIQDSEILDNWDTISEFVVEGFGTLTMDGSFAFSHDTGASNITSILITDSINTGSVTTLIIEYDYIFADVNFITNAKGYVDVYDGTSWHNLAEYSIQGYEQEHDSFDISSYTSSNNKIRFRLENSLGSENDYGFAIDNLEVYANTTSKICTPTPENKVQTIQPNPFQSVLYINLSTTQPVNIRLYDALGKLVREETPQQEGSMITLKRNGLLSGVYILEVIEQGTGTMLGRAKVIAD
jgi:hypothetical protein